MVFGKGTFMAYTGSQFSKGPEILKFLQTSYKNHHSDTIQVSVPFMLTLHTGIVLQKYASGTNSRQDEKTT